MSAIPEYDAQAAMQETLARVHEEWNDLRKQSSAGQKSWLTQIKNYYIRLVQADPEAAAEILATHEYTFEKLRKNGVTLADAKTGMRLSDVID